MAADAHARLRDFFARHPHLVKAPHAATAVAGRHHAPAVHLVAFEGAPFVGKSTLLAALAARPGTVAIPEDKDPLMLDAFLRDPPRFAFMFQMYKLARRQQLCSDLAHTLAALPLAGEGIPRLWLVDRWLPGDTAFALSSYVMGWLSDDQLAQYIERALRIPLPAGTRVVYLTASPEQHMARGRAGRSAEEVAAYDAAFFERMDVCHRAAFALLGIDPLVVDWEAHHAGLSPAGGGGRAMPAEEAEVLLKRFTAAAEPPRRPGYEPLGSAGPVPQFNY